MTGIADVNGAPLDVLQVGFDPLPDDGPAIVSCRIIQVRTAADVVAGILDQFEAAALALFPAWLPGGDSLDSASSLDVRAARALSARLASTSEHFGPFVRRIAESSVSGQRPRPEEFSRETRVGGLVRILARSYHRDRLAVLLTAPDGLTFEQQRALAAACEWLHTHGGLTIWLADSPIPDIDRFPVVTVAWQPLTTPADLAPPPVISTPSTAASAATQLRFPPVSGRPHPASAAELTLEAALLHTQWAAGRLWNPTYQPNPLDAPIRVDLLWKDEKCVVEVDGDDHRTLYKYAADRLRDNALHLNGYIVLRFTNRQIFEDLSAVLDTIGTLLHTRRGAIHGTPSSPALSESERTLQ
ncbi:DUF559 domain-containing protein [Rhodococcus sp. IEGM 1409]|uniref:endonuclease domain-containing protein n=1 Tax=Rhodococcus sp. IEGM 1409 TaxID=3047082 RepID=UPI0024B795EE|nr:DUF559 domain-containing protein [Rhodococcus sp. IEGM 1409]MDI9899405.1 DUF559 domain-containing protein [Rhodococcus sp. IEGM 1409]